MTYSISSLQPAHMYQFRLIAVNKVGESEASLPSEMVHLPEQGMYDVWNMYLCITASGAQ